MEPVSQAFLDSMLFSVGMNENDSYYHLPTKASPNPKLAASAKKKSPHKNYGMRDSLSQRYQLGKPGSRNYRQWESEFRLRKSHSESESSLSETEDADYDETYEPAYGMFAQFFVDGQVCDRLAPFLDISEADQEKLAPAPKPKTKKKKEFDCANAHAAFEHISVRSRKFLLKNYDNPLVSEIDEVINTFLRDSDAGVLDLDMETSYDRFLVHAMCHYYALNSRSYNKKGKRVVVAKKKQTVYPAVPLATYLMELGRERVELNEDWDPSHDAEGAEGEYDL